jgi:hypothetical protein
LCWTVNSYKITNYCKHNRLSQPDNYNSLTWVRSSRKSVAVQDASCLQSLVRDGAQTPALKNSTWWMSVLCVSSNQQTNKQSNHRPTQQCGLYCCRWTACVGLYGPSSGFCIQVKDKAQTWILTVLWVIKITCNIQGVPLATEPDISLIILTPMKILQRILNRGTFVVWEMKRNVSVVCL